MDSGSQALGRTDISIPSQIVNLRGMREGMDNSLAGAPENYMQNGENRVLSPTLNFDLSLKYSSDLTR